MTTAPAPPPRRSARAAGMVASVTAGLLLLLSGPAAAAQPDDDDQQRPGSDAQTWSVQPADEDGADGRASFEYLADPGASITDYAQVNNFSEQALTLRVYSQDAANTAGGGFTLLPGDQPPTGVGAWAGLDEQVTVPARDSVVVPFSLAVPDNATPGDHPGGIVASLVVERTDEEGNPVLVDHRVGSRIYLRVDGELDPVLQVTDVRPHYTTPTLPFTGGAVTVTYTVTNVGNVRLQGDPSLTVRGPFGLGERTVTLAQLSEILPGESVTTTAQVESVWPLVRLSGEVQVRPVPPLADDPTGQPATGHATVWAVPWRELIAVALLGLAAWWLWWRRRRRQRTTQAMLSEAEAKGRAEARAELHGTSG